MRNGQLSFVKTTNYEISKPRKYKADVGRVQNMEHREEKDEHLCKNRKSLTVSGVRKQKGRSGYKWETTIKGTTAPLYPILIILSFYLFLYKGSSDNLSLKNRFLKMNLCMHKDGYEAAEHPCLSAKYGRIVYIFISDNPRLFNIQKRTLYNFSIFNVYTYPFFFFIYKCNRLQKTKKEKKICLFQHN